MTVNVFTPYIASFFHSNKTSFMENTFASEVIAETAENTMPEAIAEGTEMETSFEVEATEEDVNEEEADAEDVTDEATDEEEVMEEEVVEEESTEE
jgi:hypothetical protein